MRRGSSSLTTSLNAWHGGNFHEVVWDVFLLERGPQNHELCWMPHPRLLRLAGSEVQRVLACLPPDVQAAAQECATCYEDITDAMDAGEDVEEDLLGLFEGFNRLDPLPADPEDMPRIRLFLDNLWEYAGRSERLFRKEVRITWLHELGHYLGWGEAEVEALGLG